MERALTVVGETFPLNSPFRISRGIKTAAEVVTVTIARDGLTGRGEGVPYPRYGESVESAILAIEALREAGFKGRACTIVTTTGVMWQTIIHTIFILSAIGIAWTDRLMSQPTPGDH